MRMPPKEIRFRFAYALVLNTLGYLLAATCYAQDTPTDPSPSSPWGEDLNLGFELADPSAHWSVGGKGYDVVPDTVAHSGAHSMRIALADPDLSGSKGFGVVTGHFPVDFARGKSLRLSGVLKAEGITGGQAGLWMRVDGEGGPLEFDNMGNRGVVGTTDWQSYEIVLPVPEEATNISFGALLQGNGTIWVDDFAFTVLDPPPPPVPVIVSGRVSDSEGNAVEGALVAIVPAGAPKAESRMRSGKEGRFSFEVLSGSYAFTVTHPNFCAAYEAVRSFEESAENGDVRIQLGSGGITLRGRAMDESDRTLSGALVAITRFSMDDGDIFYVEADGDGQYSAQLPKAAGYLVQAEGAGMSTADRASGDQDQVVDVMVVTPGPAPDDVVASIRSRAIPLATPEAGNGLQDLEPLRAVVGEARVVALGEATHGTREFFKLKHRILEFLVERMGFTVFAIEANWPECLAINEYVLEGKGDAKSALNGIYFWTWNTEEVLEMIEWMRRYNADPAHAKKVQFLGFDMQTTRVAAEEVLDYLGRVDAPYRTEVDSLLLTLQVSGMFDQLSHEKQDLIQQCVQRTLSRFDENRTGYVKQSSDREFAVRRQEAVLLEQAIRMYRSETTSFTARDEAMAANLQWILDTEGPATRVVVWAHNGHITQEKIMAGTTMGSVLDQALGDDYVALGFAFNRGAFQAMDWTKGQGKPGGLREHHVGPAPLGSIDATFAATGIPIFALDLRLFPAEDLAGRWLHRQRPMREIGAVFAGEEGMAQLQVLPERFDGVVFVNETTRARPVQ